MVRPVRPPVTRRSRSPRKVASVKSTLRSKTASRERHPVVPCGRCELRVAVERGAREVGQAVCGEPAEPRPVVELVVVQRRAGPSSAAAREPRRAADLAVVERVRLVQVQRPRAAAGRSPGTTGRSTRASRRAGRGRRPAASGSSTVGSRSAISRCAVSRTCSQRSASARSCSRRLVAAGGGVPRVVERAPQVRADHVQHVLGVLRPAAGQPGQRVQRADPNLVGVVAQQLHRPQEPLVRRALAFVLGRAGSPAPAAPCSSSWRSSSTRRLRSLSHNAYSATTEPAASPPVFSASPRSASGPVSSQPATSANTPSAPRRAEQPEVVASARAGRTCEARHDDAADQRDDPSHDEDDVHRRHPRPAGGIGADQTRRR